ncbi:DUF1684 domain-containing protein [Kutzneria sp. NPDC052558]|uniref:DUF1684 domain-containing protein n=1 Tax=Kutzneria sp. NPDC052558 TaxID=3364121 RepID=UPI0037C9D1EB
MSGWQEWLDRRGRDLKEPYGWLSLVGLHWLDETPRRFADVPGEWSAESGVIRVKASVSDGLSREGQPFDGVREAKGDAAEFVTHGRLRVETLIRDGRPGIRLRDPQGPALRAYDGPSVFDYSPQWLVQAEFTPRRPARRLEVDTAQPGIREVLIEVGELRFTVGGREQRLIATGGDDTISLVFHDPTNDDTTAPWRQLDAPPPADGRVTLDFNRARNFPSAFTEYGTCPKPPAGNEVTVPVTAGERRFR